MTAAAVIINILLFYFMLLSLRKPRTRGREVATIPEEYKPPAPEAAQYRTQYTPPIETDLQFYRERVRTLETMRNKAIAEENTAAAALASDENMNHYGAVIPEKILKRKRQDLYTAQRKRLAIETQLHKARRELSKAIGGA